MNRAERRRQSKIQDKQNGNQNVTLNIGQFLQLGIAHQARGELKQAEQVYRQILSVQPNQADALQLLGTIATQTGHHEQAKQLMHKSLSVNPNQPNVWYNLARAHYLSGERHESIAANTRAIALNPSHAEAYYNRANVQAEIRQYDAAIADYLQALRLDPNHWDAGRNLALTYREIQQHDACIDQLQRMIIQYPDDAQLHRSLGLTLRDVGDVAGAREHLTKAVALAPHDCELRYNLGLVKKYDAQDQVAIGEMEALAAQPNKPPQEGGYIHFALAKIYETLKDDAKAFTHYEQANAHIRSTIDYSTKRVEQYFDRLKAIFTPEFIARNQQQSEQALSKTPIFILGMPRSGSTLIEQILSSHSEVIGAGELDDLHLIVTGNPWEKRADYLTLLDQMKPEQFAAMGARYIEQMQRFGERPYVTDKMPRNAHHVGMIRLMLPQAKVIYCQRDPLDTCLSIYKHLFFGHHPYAYNQTEVAEHFLLQDELMQHWKRVMPGFVYDVSYEALVQNPEEQIRTLLDFCGLEWQENCLEFHRSDRTVRTASAMQVRQPLYKDAMQSWKRYADYITPMRDVLGHRKHETI